MSTIATSDGVYLHYKDWRDAHSPAGRNTPLWLCEHSTASAAVNSRASALILDDQPEFVAGLA